MKHLTFESTTALTFDSSVVNHHFVLRYLPPSFPGQQILTSSLTVSPYVHTAIAQDGFGNMQASGCIPFAHEEFIYTCKGDAIICEQARQVERLHPIFKYNSPLATISSDMKVFAETMPTEGTVLERSMALCQAVYDKMVYTTGSTTNETTAKDAFAQGKGVCQDLAHVFIAVSRYLGIPARYCNGLPMGTGPSHAWVEVYVDGIWTGIDPTHNRLVGEDYIRFCVGRDFGDCALERGILFGNAQQSQVITTCVAEQ
ncbi:transglutaminase family protein [Bengtsoniella intestinalis]|uniref:transglutaminase family protein n=1 Tax=Bengtsoniella intestinalis TaxID=3073143 RepID=UPI00391F9B06